MIPGLELEIRCHMASLQAATPGGSGVPTACWQHPTAGSASPTWPLCTCSSLSPPSRQDLSLGSLPQGSRMISPGVSDLVTLCLVQ